LQGKKFLHSIRLKNLLSYGSQGTTLELEPLNVLIGPNASGKSNLIEAISLLAATPSDLQKPIREGGGVVEWIWKGSEHKGSAEIGVSLEYGPRDPVLMAYSLDFEETNHRLQVRSETLAGVANPEPFFYIHDGLRIRLPRYPQGLYATVAPELKWSDLNRGQSIFSQVRDPSIYPQLTFTGEQFGRIRLFRDWAFGRRTPARQPQRVDLPDDFLREEGDNLGLVINKLKNHPPTKRLLLEKLKLFLEDIEDIETPVQGGTIQVFLHERGDRTIPAVRLSDGTLHYLCLLAILCHPEPPPLICLEEPELGMHPDIIPKIAELLVEAAQRTQLIVTTHSDALVSALSDIPEAIVVCERDDDGTTLRRLEKEKLAEWLERYQLGELWSMGEIGGNRW